MQWIKLREWLALAPADLPFWASAVMLLMLFRVGSSPLDACLAAGATLSAVIGCLMGIRRNPLLSDRYNRFKRWSYPFGAAAVVGLVGFYYLGDWRKARPEPVDPSAKPTIVSSAKFKFSATFPPPYHRVEEDSQNLTSVNGPTTLTTFIAMGNNGVLGVSVVDYLEKVFESTPIPTLLAEVEAAVVRDLKGRVESHEEFRFENHPARRFTVEHRERKGQSGYSRFELILVRPRLYTLRTSHATRPGIDEPVMKAFSASFKLDP